MSWSDQGNPVRRAVVATLLAALSVPLLALYTTVVNFGVLPDRLSGGRCPGYGDLSLTDLSPATQGDRPQDKGLLVPAGATASLGPQGAHLTLAAGSRPVDDGTIISCVVRFVHSGERIVVFTLGPAAPSTSEP